MRSVRIASAVLASAVLVAGLSACSSKSSGGDASKAGAAPAAPVADKDPKSALLASAAVMEKAGNAKLTVTGSTADDNGGGTLSWQPTQAVELTFKSDGQDATLRILGDTMYMQAPAEMSSKLGKHWLKLDSTSAAAMAKQSGSSDSQDMAMMGPMMQLFNPALELTAGAQGGKVTKVGAEQIDGAATVHYKAEISTDVMLAQLPSLTADQKTKMRAELNKDGKTSSTIDYWINAKAQLVQMGGTDFNPSKGAGAAASTASTSTLKYSDIGAATAPVAPPASDTLDFAEFMKSMGAAG